MRSGRTFRMPISPSSVVTSPDGQRFALLMDSGRLIVFEVARIGEGEDQSDAIVVDVAAHNAGSKAVAISESGLIATGSSADGVRVWSPDGELLASVPTHQDDAPTFAFAPAPTRCTTRTATGSSDDSRSTWTT